LGTEIVTIHVGPKRKSFTVHKKLICDRSEFFDKAFNGRFQEAKGVMYLAEEDIAAFDSFITYLYQDRLPQFSSTMECTAENFEAQKLCPLFFLAEKVCCNELANKVMDAIQDFGRLNELIPGNESTAMIYENTHEESKLRSYCVLMLLYIWRTVEDSDKTWVKDTTDLTRDLPDFASDFIKLQFRYRDRFQKGNVADAQVRNDEEGFGRCFFHTHAKGEVCHLESVDS
jgi:BTB/POZ domain